MDIAAASSLPALTAPQAQKLRFLTLVSLSANSHVRVLRFSFLFWSLCVCVCVRARGCVDARSKSGGWGR